MDVMPDQPGAAPSMDPMAELGAPQQVTPDMTNEMKGKILKDMIDAAIKSRADFLSSGQEIAKFGYSKDHDFQMKDTEATFKATINKTAEYIETVGPGLYQSDPDRQVITAKWAAPEAHVRNNILEMLLNYTPRETDLSSHSRRSVNEALCYGQGVMWTGFNPRKNIPQSVHDSIENLVLDADAKMLDEINWGGRKRIKPTWWLIDRYPDAKDIIASIEGGEYGSGKGKLIKFYEVYCRIGLHHYNEGMALDYGDDGMTPSTSDAPRKYVVSEEGKLIWEGSWEVPYYLDDQWPFSILWFRENPGKVWAKSPLEAGLPLQKAINLIYSLYISKAMMTTSSVIGVAKFNGQGIDAEDFKQALKAAKSGGFGIMEFEVNGEMMKLGDLIEQFELKVGIEELDRFVSLIGNAFERATGLTELVSIGQSQHQFRSAAEANMKNSANRTRFEDMAVRVQQWASLVARKEAQCARFLLKPADIALIFGDQVGQAWGMLVPPMDQQTAELVEAAMQRGITDPMDQQMFVAANAQQGVVYKQWLLETDLDIEAGSMRPMNRQQQQEAVGEAIQTVFPPLMQAGLMGPALAILKAWGTANQMPDDVLSAIDGALQIVLNPPPPPGAPGGPPTGPPQGPQQHPPGSGRGPQSPPHGAPLPPGPPRPPMPQHMGPPMPPTAKPPMHA